MLKGLTLTLVIAILAMAFSTFIPIGAVVIAIILGLLVANIVKLNDSFKPGITYAEKSILAIAIATLGINLDFRVLASLGFSTIIIIVFGMIMTIYSTIYLAKFFNIDKKFALILGIGNGVCGASAVGATKDIVKVDANQAGISVAVVNLLGTIGMFVVPAMALFFGLNETQAGILVGNTLQAVGQAVAGGFAISEASGETATVVKMGRVLLLTPLIVILLMIYVDTANEQKKSFSNIIKNVPSFIVWFIGFSLLATLGVLPTIAEDSIALISKYTLIIAMAGIGLKITLSSIKAEGKNALILGSIVFVIQIIFSLILLYLFN
jgi:uncharacterized integral membrane protein (TIGR00698 family)